MFLLRRPTDQQVARFIERQGRESFSYAEVGATSTTPPEGHTVDHNSVVLGFGRVVFERAVAALRRWAMFDVDGVRLCLPNAPITAGTTVAVLAQVGLVWSLNACRIIAVDEGERHFGFAYGTLPAHAVRGEERFLVEWRRSTDEVVYDLLAFSRPTSLVLAAARPLLRREQRRFAAGSKAAMLRAIRDDAST